MAGWGVQEWGNTLWGGEGEGGDPDPPAEESSVSINDLQFEWTGTTTG